MPACAVLFILAFSVALWRYVENTPAVIEVTGEPSARGGFRVDLNTAGAARLQLLPGIGPATAKSIVDYRLEHGPFRKLADARLVSGIGPKKFELIRPYVTLGDER